MNRIILIILITIITGTGASAQVKELEQFAEMKDVTYVYISKTMLRMAAGIASPEVPGIDIKGLMNKLSAIQIVSTEKKTVCAKIDATVEKMVKNNKYELMMSINDDTDKVKFYIKETKSSSVLLMAVNEESENVVMAFSGKFNERDVEKLMNESQRQGK